MSKQVLTVSCKLSVTPEVAQNIDATLQAFCDACNWINQTVDKKVMGKVPMQTMVYQDVRLKFELGANLAIRAIGRVCESRKSAKAKKSEVKQFKPTSCDYDARTFSFNEHDWTVSLNLIQGRAKGIKLDIGDYQKQLLQGKKPTSAELVKRKDSLYFLQIQVKDEPPESIKTSGVLGIDLGRKDIAHTSQGDGFSGEQINRIRDHYASLRASIQRKATQGTRTTRRRCREILKRLAGKERRFQSWLNHQISYRLIQQAKQQSMAIALEDLSGIRERTNQQPRSKQERRRSNSWAFYQLRSFLVYKAVKFGVPLVFVNPAYSSQTCHKCLHIHPEKGKSYRNGKTYKCGYCGWIGDSDFNGANMISLLGAAVNTPGGSNLSCQIQGY